MSALLRKKRKPKSQRHFKTPRCVVRGCVRAAIGAEFPLGTTVVTETIYVDRCRSHALAEADRAWSLEVRGRAEECEAAGWTMMPNAVEGGIALVVACGGPIQAAHGIPRGYRKTRLIPLNGFAICSGHHRWFTSKPLEWTQFMIDRLGALPYEELRRLALS